jgi:hypothetical protein
MVGGGGGGNGGGGGGGDGKNTGTYLHYLSSTALKKPKKHMK